MAPYKCLSIRLWQAIVLQNIKVRSSEWSGQCGAASNASNLLCGSVFVVIFCMASTKDIKGQMEWEKELPFCGFFKTPSVFNTSHGCVLTFFHWLLVCHCLIFYHSTAIRIICLHALLHVFDQVSSL